MQAKKLGCGALIISNHYVGNDSDFKNQLPKEPYILLLQRGFGAPTYPGCLGGPGGLYEPENDNDSHDAVIRETAEESNINFTPTESPFYEGSMSDRDLRYFLGDWTVLPGGICHKDGEAIGHLWVSGKQGLNMNNLSFRYKEAIQRLVDYNIL